MKKEIGAKYDANTVTAEQLASIPRIGLAMGEIIVEARNKNGGFSDISQMKGLPGMGAKKMETLAEYLGFDGAIQPAPEKRTVAVSAPIERKDDLKDFEAFLNE